MDPGSDEEGCMDPGSDEEANLDILGSVPRSLTV